MVDLTATAEDVDHTGRTTTTAQWGVAAVVMVGSAVSAGVGFDYLGEHAAIGVITGLGVDLALASGLIIGRRLRAVGITTRWGTVLLWLTGAMTLALNSGAAALTGRWVLAVAHAFLPVLLVVLCEAGSEAQLKLHRLARQAAADEQAQRDAQLAAEQASHDAQQRRLKEQARQRANGVLIAAQDFLNKASELRRQAEQEQAEAARMRATKEADLAATKTVTERLSRVQHKRDNGTSARNKPVVASREERREWVRQEHAADRKPTGSDVNNKFGPPRTGAAIVAEVEAEKQRPLHAVRSGH